MPPSKAPKTPAPPAHLSPAARAWWSSIYRVYAMEPPHLRVLTAACESWDRCEQARQELAAAGALTYADRNGIFRSHPAVAIERDARAAFRSALKQLRLDEDEPRSVLGRPTLGSEGDF